MSDFNWGSLGFGGLAGYAAGFAFKRLGRMAAFLLGVLFIVLQTLAYLGYISIDWTRVESDLAPAVSGAALSQAWDRLVSVMTYNLPFAAAFMPGFWLGLRSG